jgi:hypothetical protein
MTIGAGDRWVRNWMSRVAHRDPRGWRLAGIICTLVGIAGLVPCCLWDVPPSKIALFVLAATVMLWFPRRSPHRLVATACLVMAVVLFARFSQAQHDQGNRPLLTIPLVERCYAISVDSIGLKVGVKRRTQWFPLEYAFSPPAEGSDEARSDPVLYWYEHPVMYDSTMHRIPVWGPIGLFVAHPLAVLAIRLTCRDPRAGHQR